MNNIEKYKLKDIGKWEDRIYDHECTFGEGKEDLPTEKNRYRLIGTAADAFTQYIRIILRLEKLDDIISVGLLDYLRPENGSADYVFSLCENSTDPVLGAHSLSEIYDLTGGKSSDHTIPVLVDASTGRIVNNDPFGLAAQLEGIWHSTFSPESVQLRPAEFQGRIDAHISEIFTNLFVEGYRAGFATDQIDYDKGYCAVFAQLDRYEKLLSDRRYLLGDILTDADILLYTFLVRFDIQYAAGFRLNRNFLRDLPNLYRYSHELYCIDEFRKTTDLEAVKKHTFLDCLVTNPYNKLPLGPDISDWENYLKESEC